MLDHDMNHWQQIIQEVEEELEWSEQDWSVHVEAGISVKENRDNQDIKNPQCIGPQKHPQRDLEEVLLLLEITFKDSSWDALKVKSLWEKNDADGD